MPLFYRFGFFLSSSVTHNSFSARWMLTFQTLSPNFDNFRLKEEFFLIIFLRRDRKGFRLFISSPEPFPCRHRAHFSPDQ